MKTLFSFFASLLKRKEPEYVSEKDWKNSYGYDDGLLSTKEEGLRVAFRNGKIEDPVLFDKDSQKICYTRDNYEFNESVLKEILALPLFMRPMSFPPKVRKASGRILQMQNAKRNDYQKRETEKVLQETHEEAALFV